MSHKNMPWIVSTDPEETERCIGRSNIIECRAGDPAGEAGQAGASVSTIVWCVKHKHGSKARCVE